MATTIEADPAIAYAFPKAVLTLTPGPRNPDLDIWFNSDVGIAYATASGEKPFAGIVATVTAYATASGTPIWGNAYEGTATAYAFAEGDLLLENLRSNWVKWSNIGQMDFTIGRDNVAGERPLDFKGWVYAIKKLGSRAIAYGKNGVSALIPAGTAWGLQTVYRIGLKSKNAIAGDESIHFFIDNKDQLFSLGESLQKLDYSEYLSVLTNPVLSYDLETGLLYICDGEYGFVYNHANKSLGTGPISITGISSQGGTLYVTSPVAIVMPTFEFCTDIYDLGTRRGKTIYSLEIGTDLGGDLQAAIDWRTDKKEAFATTNWFMVDRRGMVHIACYGKEFRFRVKTFAWEPAGLDYITVNGEVHQH